MMNSNLMNRFALIFLLTASPYVLGGSFEGTGIVEAVDKDRNLVTVDDVILSLPRSVLWEGQAAIEQLNPGQRVGVSGPDGSPYPIIDSLHIQKDMGDQR